MPSFVSKACGTSEPEIGPRLDNGKWRVLVGWNHINDTVDGLATGKIWGWVSAPPEKFQVYDQNFNRGGIGEVRDCGVANFTMVRMFHTYWCLSRRQEGRVKLLETPKDGRSSHKKHCRKQYKELIKRHRQSLGLPVDDSEIEDVDEDELTPAIKQKTKRTAKTRTAGPKGRRRRTAKNVQTIPTPSDDESVAGDHVFDPMSVDSNDEEDRYADYEQQSNDLRIMSSPEEPPADAFENAEGDIAPNPIGLITDYFLPSRFDLLTNAVTPIRPDEEDQARDKASVDINHQASSPQDHSDEPVQQEANVKICSDPQDGGTNATSDIPSAHKQFISMLSGGNVVDEVKHERHINPSRLLEGSDVFANTPEEGEYENPIEVE